MDQAIAAAAELQAAEARALFERLAASIESVMRGQHEAVRRLLAAFASGGHVLIEDFPGTGKTTLAKSLAATIGCRFTRVQFTPDLLPSDILGVSVFNQKKKTPRMSEGSRSGVNCTRVKRQPIDGRTVLRG